MMAAATLTTPLPLRLLDPTYLQSSKAAENLEKLSSPKYSSAPPTGCMTREVYKKVPFFKPTQSSIQKKCVHIATTLPFSLLLYRIFNGAIGFALLRGEEWQTNFFPVASECLGKSISQLGEPTSRLITYTHFFTAALAALGIYVSARIFFHDYSEKTRFSLLDKEYTAIRETLLTELTQAKKDKEALKKIIGVAARLETNLPRIESDLKWGCRLSSENIDSLMLKLTHPISQILKADIKAAAFSKGAPCK